MARIRTKQNDTRPVVNATLLDAAGAPVSLTGATVKFIMRAVDASTTKVDSAATVVDSSAGRVRYTWVAADTDTVGEFEAEFEVTYSDGGVETFPKVGYITVTIADDV